MYVSTKWHSSVLCIPKITATCTGWHKLHVSLRNAKTTQIFLLEQWGTTGAATTDQRAKCVHVLSQCCPTYDYSLYLLCSLLIKLVIITWATCLEIAVEIIITTGWAKKLDCFWAQITLQRLMLEIRAICQKFQNFVRMKCLICMSVHCT